MINVIGAMSYCIDDITKIENYDKAIADKEHTWVCHHKLETQDKWGKVREHEIPRDALIVAGVYYYRPAKELVFLTTAEHNRVHTSLRNFDTDNVRNKGTSISKSKMGHTVSEETRRKLSNAFKGIPNPKNGKKVRNMETGEIFISVAEARRHYNCTIKVLGLSHMSAGYHWEYV